MRTRGLDLVRLRVRGTKIPNQAVPAGLIAAMVIGSAGWVIDLLEYTLPLAAVVVAGTLLLERRGLPTTWTISVLPDRLAIVSGGKAGSVEAVLPFGDIETIRIVKTAIGSRTALSVTTDTGGVLIGGGLSADALGWLKRYLVTEIAGLSRGSAEDSDGKAIEAWASPESQPYAHEAELSSRLVALFLQHAPEVVRKLQRAVEDREPVAIKREAHWLRSSSADVGASRLVELCRLLEVDVLNDDLSKADLLHGEISDEFERVEALLQGSGANSLSGVKSELPPEPLPLYEVGRKRGSRSSEPDADARSGLTAPKFAAKILLVEDNPINQEVAREFLREFGCDVEVAENGQQAVDAWDRTAFDMILMDCQMPVMDGFQATRLIRQREDAQGWRPVPIVALTANALEGDREQCLAAGMVDYISKPYTPQRLQQVLARWLARSQRWYADSDVREWVGSSR